MIKLFWKLVEQNYNNTYWYNRDSIHAVTVKNLGLVSI